MRPLTVAEAGPVLVIDRSVDLAAALTWVVADAELLAAFGSGSLPVMLALLVMLPGVPGAVALMVMVELAADASEPTGQVTVPALLVQLAVEPAGTKVVPAGRVSVTTTPVAASGPALAAVRV